MSQQVVEEQQVAEAPAASQDEPPKTTSLPVPDMVPPPQSEEVISAEANPPHPAQPAVSPEKDNSCCEESVISLKRRHTEQIETLVGVIGDLKRKIIKLRGGVSSSSTK
jgi:hypothetical protein